MLETKEDGAQKVTVIAPEVIAEVSDDENSYENNEETQDLLQRLTNHVNREIGVSQDTPLHTRLDDLIALCERNFGKIAEKTILLK